MRLISAAEEAALHARAERAESEADRLRTQNAQLLSTVLSLKGKGATDQTPLPKTTDRVSEVIADVAGPNHALRRQLGAWARQQRADKVDEDQIIKGLFNWPDDDSGVPE